MDDAHLGPEYGGGGLDEYCTRGAVPAGKIRHPKAPPDAVPVMKYGECHYPEETVPNDYTMVDDFGRKCRYILVFLVYNNKGERLQRLSQVAGSVRKAQPLALYGQLIPVNALLDPRGTKVNQVKSLLKSKRKRDYETMGPLAPYPIIAYLEELVLEYGQLPCDKPAMWLRSRSDVYYRLEHPAGRYERIYYQERRRFDVCTRFLKTLQVNPSLQLQELLNLMQYGMREPPIEAKSCGCPGQCMCGVAAIEMKPEDERKLSPTGSSADDHLPSPSDLLSADKFSDGEGQGMPGNDSRVYFKSPESPAQMSRRRHSLKEELTPWGERFRLYPPLSRHELVTTCGNYIKDQALILGRGVRGDPEWFVKLPAMTQLLHEMGSQHRAVDPMHVMKEPELDGRTAAETPPMMNAVPPSQCSPYPALGRPAKMPALPYGGQMMMFPRLTMRTALHVVAAKPIYDESKPCFQGHDWLWSPHVVNSQAPPFADDLDYLVDIQPQPPIVLPP